MKPMLAYNKQFRLEDLRYPLLGSFKYDGIRCIVDRNGMPLTRKLKEIPNVNVRRALVEINYTGVDGELIVGDPSAPDVYNTTASAVMSRYDPGAIENLSFVVFDIWALSSRTYEERFSKLKTFGPHKHVIIAYQKFLESPDDVLQFERVAVNLGYEGIMLRDPKAPYKFGRSTLREQFLLKLKRFHDSEAVVLSVYPRMHNANPATRDKLGNVKRSSAKANKVEMEEAGGFLVKDRKTGVEFECSTGVFTQAQRKQLWAMRKSLPGLLLKYRFQPAGVKDKPRFPRATGFRSALDI